MPERQAVGAASPLSRFTYRGPTSGMTLKREGTPPLEVMLYDGKDVDIPADHPHVVTLVAQGFLVPSPTIEGPAAAPAVADITSAQTAPSRAKLKDGAN